jgi:polysaccharide biosynthesis transport protein
MTEEIRLAMRQKPETSPTVRDLLAIMFRQRRVATFYFLAVFSGILSYGLICPPYKSEMKVLVRRGRQDPVIAPTPSQAELVHEGVTEEELNSEAELLQDDEILKIVVGDPNVSLRPHSWLHLWENEDERTARAARRLKGRLKVETLKKTNLINVSYKSSDPVEDCKVLQALGTAYLSRHTQLHRPGGQAIFFDQQVEESRRALRQAEARLVAFTRGQKVVEAAMQRDAILHNLSDTDADAHQSAVSVAATSQRIRTLEHKLDGLPERAVTTVRQTDNPELMGRMKSRLLDLELSRAELVAKYEPSYRSVRDLDQEISDTKASIARELQAPLRDQTTDQDPNHEWARAELLKAEVDLNTVKAHAAGENALRKRYQEEAGLLGEKAIQQDRLVDDLKEAGQRYLLYVNKREEARIGDELDQGGILDVTIAEQPTLPVLPQLSGFGFAALGLLGGAFVGVGAAFVNDRMSPSFRTPDEVLAYLGSPVLASLPRKNG